MSWWTGKRITVTGAHGFLGRSVVALLRAQEARTVFCFSSEEYNLIHQSEVARMYADQQPDVVIHLAARVGGIGANRDNPARFFYENAIMGMELIEQARRNDVQKFVQIGTVCSYPKLTPVPFDEADLWNGYPEDTNAAYGIAKKALLVQGQSYRVQYGLDFICLLPANLYGPGDNFDLESCHVIPAMIRKCVEAREARSPTVEAWGSGKPTREFLYVDDAARGILMATERYSGPEPLNLGCGEEVAIGELVGHIARLTGFTGQIKWNSDRPDGQPRRRLNVERAAHELGFRARVNLETGLRRTVTYWTQKCQVPMPTRWRDERDG